MLPSLTPARSEFHTVGAATEKAQVPACVRVCRIRNVKTVTTGSSVGFLAGMSIKFRYAGCVD